MTNASAQRSDFVSSDRLVRLVASRAITQFQAEWIEGTWPNLDADAFAHPYLRDVREHTRTYLERAA